MSYLVRHIISLWQAWEALSLFDDRNNETEEAGMQTGTGSETGTASEGPEADSTLLRVFYSTSQVVCFLMGVINTLCLFLSYLMSLGIMGGNSR